MCSAKNIVPKVERQWNDVDEVVYLEDTEEKVPKVVKHFSEKVPK